ncbi:MAG: type II toxin-antitoxin system RelE/ParE family toxin [Nitrospiraceae bacterium]|nr:MAG: type II toxin-antitoxin system RelE/ParE family toxin [Nitrospiraceae bacterium]
MAELIWSERAISDIENIYDYIALDSLMYARLTSESIIDSVERLQGFPESGRHLPEFSQMPYKEVTIGNYRVIYKYDSGTNEVKIVTVVHGSRLLTKEILSE